MVLTETPICEYGLIAPDFTLEDCFGNRVARDDVVQENGLLVMFICNHCPYVQAILPRLEQEMKKVRELGIGVVAINSNDAESYPEDSPEKMTEIVEKYGLSFPYCYDPSQQVAREYGAVCTPDFFGYNANLELQYRGRLDDSGRDQPSENTQHELLEAMQLIAQTSSGPEKQTPSMGCSIKWIET